MSNGYQDLQDHFHLKSILRALFNIPMVGYVSKYLYVLSLLYRITRMMGKNYNLFWNSLIIICRVP
jgi:hypothetical protein